MRKNNRGVSLELALITLLVIFGLCLILLTVAELSASLNKKMVTDVTNRVDVARIGDIFVRLCRADSSGRNNYDLFIPSSYKQYKVEKFVYTVEDHTRYAMTARDLNSNKMVLCVVCDDQGNILRFTKSAEDFTLPTEETESVALVETTP